MSTLSGLRSALLGPAYQHHVTLIRRSKSWSTNQSAAFQRRWVEPLLQRYGPDVRTKDHYREHLARYGRWNLPGLTKTVTTGGTTGSPFRFRMDTLFRRQKERAYIFDIWSEVGYRPFDTRVVFRGNISDQLITRNWLENSWIISPSRLTRTTAPEVLRFLHSLGPFYLHVYPSSLFTFVSTLGSDAFRSLPVRGVLAGSEAFPPAQMRAFEEAYGTRLAYWYGHSEYATLARYCRHCEGFHFYPTYGHTEFVPFADGTHHIIATSFNRIGTQFVRYDTGDLATLSDRRCSQPFERIDAVAGRVQEYFVDRDGERRAFGPFLFGIHNEFWDYIRGVQFYQRVHGAMGVRVIYQSGTSDAQKRWLVDYLSQRFAPVDLHVEPVEHIATSASGKHRYYVNEASAPARD